MEVAFTPTARLRLEFWKKSGNKKIQQKIADLVESIAENPEAGIGKPEKLKHNMSGAWSRRINEEHRLLYEILEGRVEILSLKGHYE